MASAAGEVASPIFHGLNIFVTQRCPTRSTILAAIERHGGVIVKLDSNADHIIADHLRRDCPPGSLSYTWIETSVRDQRLADKDSHRAGPSTGPVRVAPGLQRPSGGRVPFTAQDDIVLWNWVQQHGSKSKGILGNELYKQLEAVVGRLGSIERNIC